MNPVRKLFTKVKERFFTHKDTKTIQKDTQEAPAQVVNPPKPKVQKGAFGSYRGSRVTRKARRAYARARLNDNLRNFNKGQSSI